MNNINWSKFETSEGTFVKFQPNVEKRLVFADGQITSGDTTITVDGVEKQVYSINLVVTEEDSIKVEKQLNITSKRLAQQLRTYIEDGSIFKNEFGVKQTGSGYQTNYVVRVTRSLVV